jgi:hypothetical protein
MSIWKRWLKSFDLVSRPVKGRSRKSAPRRAARRLSAEHLEERLAPAAAVWTDKPDYAPGTTAIIGGSGFQVGETVQMQVLRTDGVPDYPDGNLPWQVQDGDNSFTTSYVDASGMWHRPDLDGQVDGNIQTTWYVEPQYAGASLELTATGLTSGETASAPFTDAAISSTATGGNWSAASSWAPILLTGKITTLITSPTVTGTSTHFTTELAPGSILQTTGGATLGTVLSIASDTSLTLTSNASQTIGTAVNFNAQVVPDSADTVTIATTGINSITVDTSAVANSITMNAGSRLTISGGSLATASGQDFTNNGTLTISSGTLTIGRDFLGSGTSIMTGGTLKIGHDFRLATAGVNSWSATGGTIEFTTVSNADGSQFTGVGAGGIQFNNLAISGSGDAALDTGGKTIKVRGVFTNTNTNVNNKTWTAGTVVFNGSASQSIAAVSHGSLSTRGSATTCAAENATRFSVPSSRAGNTRDAASR